MLKVQLIFRITDKATWERARIAGVFSGELHSDGFIHFSNADQVVRVANRLYSGQTQLVLLAVDRSLLEASLKEEDLYGLGEPFPHLYSPLAVKAVLEAIEFPAQSDGSFVLPQGVNALIR